ncbi:MAG: oligosaccharide flippase family protein [Chitinophagaceae bacterium]|nr:oligosaccharide flippase family protein [Chitinophagaceae bacterium]
MAALKNKMVYQLLLSATQVLLPLVTYPYITRILGPDNLGKVNYVDFVSQVFMILAAFGIPFYAVREIATTRDNAFKRAALIKELVLLQAIFAVLSTGVFLLFTFRNWPSNPALYATGMANILISAFSFDWYIQGMEQFRFAAVRTILVRVTMLVSFFILVKNEQDYSIYFAIFSVGMLVIALFNSIKMLQETHFSKEPVNLRKHLVPLWHFFLTSSAISIYVYFDTIILKHITQNDQVVGYYTTVLKMVKIFIVIIIAMGTVLMPRMSYLAGAGKTAEIKMHANKLLQFILVAGLPLCCGLFMLAPEIIQTIAGDKFMPAVPLMRILAFLPLIIGLSNLFCFQTLVPFKQERKFLLAVIVGCITSVSLNFLLIPSLSAQGAAYATTITELIITIITGILAYRFIQFEIKTSSILQTFFTSLLFIPLILLCRNVFASPLMVLSIAIPSCCTLYFFIQYFIFNNIVVKEIKQYVQNLLKF